MAQWISSWTLHREVPGSNLVAAAEVPLGKALHPHYLDPWKGLKVYLYPNDSFWYVKGTYFRSPLHSYSEKKVHQVMK